MGNGVTLYQDISGSLDAKNIVMDVLVKGIEMSDLMSAIKTTVQVPKLDANIPILTSGAVSTDVEEMEHTETNGGAFSVVNFSLKKDRVKLAISDEAEYRSMTGNPLDIQKNAAAARLAAALDDKIIAALETSPQTTSTAGAWSTSTNNPLADLGVAAAGLRPYKADFVIMTSNVWAKYIANDFVKSVGTGNPPALKGAVGTVPGLDLNIFIDDTLTAKSCMVGASNGMPAILGQGPVKVRTDDSMDGGTIYQMDVYRQVKAPIMTNGSSLNMAAYQVTSVIG